MNHPVQPIYTDEQGTYRFKENKIVRYILDNGSIDLNQIAKIDFSDEDREHFAQLIGYSLYGFSDLGYVSDDTFDAAEKMAKEGKSETDARLEDLQSKIDFIREKMKDVVSSIYKIHPDSLEY